jgi:hypothetical protein
MPPADYPAVFAATVADSRYLANLDWGKPRVGHPEGTVRAHIAELEGNLERLRAKLSEEEYWKLKILVHTHDTFKAEAKPGVAITHPESHASLARAFLASHCDDPDLLAMVQFHDEPFALYRQYERRGEFDRGRFESLMSAITDLELFLAFVIIDGCTAGKSREPLAWFFRQLAGRGGTRFGNALVAELVRVQSSGGGGVGEQTEGLGR